MLTHGGSDELMNFLDDVLGPKDVNLTLRTTLCRLRRTLGKVPGFRESIT
jgi:hypothetical protein